MIVNSQKDDVKLQEIVQLVSTRDKTDYVIDESRGLFYKSRLCVSNVMDLRKKMYQDMK